MKHTKIVALATALTLALSPMAVMASDVSLEGDVNYVNTTIYKVKLPTTAGMSFTIDPQGLSSLDGEDGEYSADAAGKIISTGKMTATNLSSVDVKLSAKFYLADTDTGSDSLTLTSDGAIANQDKKEIGLTITTNDTTTSTVYVTATDASGSSTDFTMTKATYNFTKNTDGTYDYELDPTTGSNLEMTIGGTVAKEYDWSAYTTGETPATLTLHSVFSFTDPAATDPTAEITPEVEAAPSIANTDVTYSKTSGATVTVDLGGGELAATKIASFATSSNGTTFNTATVSSSLTGNTLTLDSGLFSSATTGSIRYLKVVFDDTAKTAVVLTLTLAD